MKDDDDLPKTLRVPYSWREEDQQKEMDLLDAIIAQCQREDPIA